MSEYKSMAHSIRDILEGKLPPVDPNKEDLDKLKKVAKVEDESAAEEKLDEKALEFGTDAARDKYSNDTPGQTAGIEHDPIQHQHKAELAIDGVPQPGGMIAKPKLGLKEAIREVVNADDKKALEKLSKGLEGSVKAHKKQKKELDKAIDEEQIDELSSKTMKNYIRKAASPIQKNSAPNLASKAAHKLATSDDMDAGEKEDKKAFNRGQGIQRAAKKLYSRTSDKEMRKEEKNCGCGKDPCETYGMKNEEGRWDETDDGKAYRAMSPEEKHQHKLKKEVMRKSKQLKGKKTYAREDVMSVLGEIVDRYLIKEECNLGEAMSPAERKMAANKIFRMHQAKQASKQKNSPAAKAARRDAKGYKTYDDSHLDKPAPKHDAPKRGRGERDLPHIATQLRGVVDMGAKHSGVKFKDGTTKKVHPDHAKSWLKKHDSSKPAQRLAMYKSHDSHSEFQKHK